MRGVRDRRVRPRCGCMPMRPVSRTYWSRQNVSGSDKGGMPTLVAYTVCEHCDARFELVADEHKVSER